MGIVWIHGVDVEYGCGPIGHCGRGSSEKIVVIFTYIYEPIYSIQASL
jgi:hypothetical protein